MKAEEVARRLNARRSGDGWVASCPAHEDHSPSLSIGAGDRGQVLLNCHAGCSFSEIVAALGLKESDLGPGRAAVPDSPQASYTYRDEDGHTVLTVRRWRRADGTKTFSREPRGVPASRVPLYRLPDLRTTSRVVVVEGEKDADRLWSLGIAATTNAGGAGKWQSHHAGQLVAAGATEAVLVPDNDETGERHMHAVAEALRSAGLKVAWCALPDRPMKGDVSDVLDRGVSVQQLQLLLDQAPVYVPPTDLALLSYRDDTSRSAPCTRLHLVTASTIAPCAVRWLWPGRVALGKTTMIAGHPGLGKSQLTCCLAAAVSTGAPLPGGSHAPLGDVIMVSAEDDASDTIVPRLMAAGADLSRIHLLDGVREENKDQHRERGFDLVADVAWLDEALAARPYVRLVIIDPVTAYMGGSDTHRTADVRAVLRPIERVAQKHNVAILLVSHLNKAGGGEAQLRVNGSTAFVAAPRAAFIVVRDPEEEDRRLLLEVKNNLSTESSGLAFRVEAAQVAAGIETSRIAWTGEPVTITANEVLAAQAASTEDRTARDEAVAWLRDALHEGPRPRREIEEAAKRDGISLSTLKRAAKISGVAMARAGFGLGSIWSLPAAFGSPRFHSAQALPVSRMTPPEPNGVLGPRSRGDGAPPISHGHVPNGQDADDSLLV